MKQSFLDTGYVLALELANDQSHEVVSRHWQALAGRLPQLVTTSFVLDEIVTFFNSRGFHEKAVEVGNNLQCSRMVEMVHVDEPLFQAGWAYLIGHQDKRYSLTDCVSFELMNRLGIITAFTLDHHFVQAGFQVEP